MLPCIDLTIPDTWVPSEVHTLDDAHKHACAAARARTRAYAAAGCEHGRSAHTERDIYIFTQPYTSFAGMLRQILVVRTHAARRHRNTDTQTHTHTHTRARTIEASIRTLVYIQRGKGLCMCALDIDRLGCRGSSMALEHRCVSNGDPSTYTLIRIATCARARASIGGAAAHNDRACVGDRPSAVRSGARRVGSGAYRVQVRDGGGVPRADVRVEGRRRPKRLRAD
jgi:hypothetical protein